MLMKRTLSPRAETDPISAQFAQMPLNWKQPIEHAIAQLVFP
jgi:hypothetical protein